MGARTRGRRADNATKRCSMPFAGRRTIPSGSSWRNTGSGLTPQARGRPADGDDCHLYARPGRRPAALPGRLQTDAGRDAGRGRRSAGRGQRLDARRRRAGGRELSRRTLCAARPARGLNVARNAAMQAASGEIVVFIDDDAVPERGWLDAHQAGVCASADDGVDGLTLPLGAGK